MNCILKQTNDRMITMNYIVMDLEWNMGSRKEELKMMPFEIIEIGAVKLDDDMNETGRFSRLIRPRVYRNMHRINGSIVHISDRDLKDAESFEEVYSAFLVFCKESTSDEGEYIFCTWGDSDLTELQRNINYFDCLPLGDGPIEYLDVQKLFGYNCGEPKNRVSLEKAVAYVIMNCVAANICLEPSGYRWGSGNLCFNGTLVSGTRLGDLSQRAQIRILKSNVVLPGEYLIGQDGYILPQSYINIIGLEALFRTPKRMNYFLRTSSKAKLRLEKEAAPSFRDQIILSAYEDLCHSLFRVNQPSELSEDQMAEMLHQLKYRFSADLNQLCRVTGIPYADAAKLMDMH